MRAFSTKTWAVLALGTWVGLGVAACDSAAARPRQLLPAASADPTPPSSGAVPPGAATLAVPEGWRDVKLGMSEQEVQRVILRYQAKTSRGWQSAKRPILPTVRLSEEAIDSTAVDPVRFHEWSVDDLDDGAGQVRAWHEDGALVAIEMTGKVPTDVFVRKAAEAYGGAPRLVQLRFTDRATGAQEVRDVAIWRGASATALVWTTRSVVPTLLLWSNDAMTRRAAEWQTSLDAPSAAAKVAAQASEKATMF